MRIMIIAAACVAALMSGCQREATPGNAAATPSPESSPSVKMGTYRAVLRLPSGELPFGLVLEKQGANTVGYLQNGKERVELTDVAVAGAHLDIHMPGYQNRLTADAAGDRLTGELYEDKLHGKDQRIPFTAQFGREYRFFPNSSPGSADVSGRWAVQFVDDDGAAEVAVGEFTQSGDTVAGTFLTTTGDHRYLAGQVRGDELNLSTFDGAHAFLYKAKLGADGALSGDYWSGLAYHEKWTAKRDNSAALPDAYKLTTMRSGAKHFDFSFPDVTGATVTSKDEQFRGKVLIVAIAGSWCPNCHDEAAYLAPLYKEYRSKGLEIVSLMFEHFGDFPRAAQATQRFRQHYGIEYTMLIAGISDKDDAGKRLPMLDKVYAFPTTIFIDRKGVVRKIHTGFSGPATGEHYTQFQAEVKDILDQLLAES
jgi:peroxiredoxin